MKKILLWIPIVFLLALGITEARPIYQSNTTKIATNTAWNCINNYGFDINFTENSTMVADELLLANVTFWSDINATTQSNITVNWNTTKTIFWINFTDIPAGTYYYRWYAMNATSYENATENLTYTISRATPNLKSVSVNDTYISFNGTCRVDANVTGDGCWDRTGGSNFTVIVRAQKANENRNYTMLIGTNDYGGNEWNYTFYFNKTYLGESQNNVSRVNITYIYIDANTNYTGTSNTSSLYCDYARTNALTVTAPSTADYNQMMNFRTNYTALDNELIKTICTVMWNSRGYDMSYSSGYQTVGFINDRTDRGTYAYGINCTNSSYQTQTASGDIASYGTGGSGGSGGGATSTVTTTTATTTVSLCGNGICDSGEYAWNCWKDCNPFKGQETMTTIPIEIPESIEEVKETVQAMSPIVVIILVLIGIWILRKI